MGNFTTVMATTTMHIFPVLAYQDQKWYMYRYLRKPKTMKVRTFTTRLIKLNNYLPYFPPDCVGQLVIALPDDEVEEILHHAMRNLWRKKGPSKDTFTLTGLSNKCQVSLKQG